MKRTLLVLIAIIFTNVTYPQESDVEIFIIDSYVTMEKPYTFNLSFFTTQPVKAELTIADEYNFTITDSLAEDHKINIDLVDYRFDSTYVKYLITVKTENGTIIESDINEFTLPYKNELLEKEETSLLTVCCFGGVIFGLPSASAVFIDGETKFSLTKEIPVISFYSGGYNYPDGYLSLEYSHIFDSYYRNFLRIGYKQVFSVEPIEFVSGGVNLFTTFQGYNGFSPEVTIGWFKVYSTFTVYSRYRYNYEPSGVHEDFHEVSIGLYSNFFSINL